MTRYLVAGFSTTSEAKKHVKILKKSGYTHIKIQYNKDAPKSLRYTIYADKKK